MPQHAAHDCAGCDCPKHRHVQSCVIRKLEKRSAELVDQVQRLQLDNETARVRYDLLAQLSTTLRMAMDVTARPVDGMPPWRNVSSTQHVVMSTIDCCISHLMSDEQAGQWRPPTALRLPSSLDTPLAPSLADGSALSVVHQSLSMVQMYPKQFAWVQEVTLESGMPHMQATLGLMAKYLTICNSTANVLGPNSSHSLVPGPNSAPHPGPSSSRQQPPSGPATGAAPTPADSTGSSSQSVAPGATNALDLPALAAALQHAKQLAPQQSPVAGALAFAGTSGVVHAVHCDTEGQAGGLLAQLMRHQQKDQQQQQEQQKQQVTPPDLQALIDVWAQVLEEGQSSNSGAPSFWQTAAAAGNMPAPQQAPPPAPPQQQLPLQAAERALIDLVIGFLPIGVLEYLLFPSMLFVWELLVAQRMPDFRHMTEALQLSPQQLCDIVDIAGAYAEVQLPLDQRQQELHEQLEQLSAELFADWVDGPTPPIPQTAQLAAAAAGLARAAQPSSAQLRAPNVAAQQGVSPLPSARRRGAVGQLNRELQPDEDPHPHQQMLQLCKELEQVGPVVAWYQCALGGHILGLMTVRQVATMWMLSSGAVGMWSKWLLVQLEAQEPWLLQAMQGGQRGGSLTVRQQQQQQQPCNQPPQAAGVLGTQEVAGAAGLGGPQASAGPPGQPLVPVRGPVGPPVSAGLRQLPTSTTAGAGAAAAGGAGVGAAAAGTASELPANPGPPVSPAAAGYIASLAAGLVGAAAAAGAPAPGSSQVPPALRLVPGVGGVGAPGLAAAGAGWPGMPVSAAAQQQPAAGPGAVAAVVAAEQQQLQPAAAGGSSSRLHPLLQQGISSINNGPQQPAAVGQQQQQQHQATAGSPLDACSLQLLQVLSNALQRVAGPLDAAAQQDLLNELLAELPEEA